MSWRVVYRDSGRPVSAVFVLTMTNVGHRIRSDVLRQLMEDVEIVWSE
jgi:hypothetical protein